MVGIRDHITWEGQSSLCLWLTSRLQKQSQQRHKGLSLVGLEDSRSGGTPYPRRSNESHYGVKMLISVRCIWKFWKLLEDQNGIAYLVFLVGGLVRAGSSPGQNNTSDNSDSFRMLVPNNRFDMGQSHMGGDGARDDNKLLILSVPGVGGFRTGRRMHYVWGRTWVHSVWAMVSLQCLGQLTYNAWYDLMLQEVVEAWEEGRLFKEIRNNMKRKRSRCELWEHLHVRGKKKQEDR